ncbi:MAG TPA: hypothetical protein VN670_00625, partial [Acidobacteriaceae bacterium]|nr:hypothetical protein [Acidobacteriaceae bacterium]
VENPGSRAILGEWLPDAIVGSGAPDDLAEAVMRVLPDGPARSVHLAGQAEIARRFTIENMVKMTAAAYEEVLHLSTVSPTLSR